MTRLILSSRGRHEAASPRRTRSAQARVEVGEQAVGVGGGGGRQRSHDYVASDEQLEPVPTRVPQPPGHFVTDHRASDRTADDETHPRTVTTASNCVHHERT